MAGILNSVYAVLVLVVAVGGIAGMMWLTRDNVDARRTGDSGFDIAGAIVAAAVALFVIALIVVTMF